MGSSLDVCRGGYGLATSASEVSLEEVYDDAMCEMFPSETTAMWRQGYRLTTYTMPAEQWKYTAAHRLQYGMQHG